MQSNEEYNKSVNRIFPRLFARGDMGFQPHKTDIFLAAFQLPFFLQEVALLSYIGKLIMRLRSFPCREQTFSFDE